MNAKEVLKKLQDRNIKMVAEKSGVNYMALLRFSQGKTKRPSYDMIIKVLNYLEK